jgi:hypothetical protein
MPFKKIFKPVRKVLDKIIPNEIKPALPYLAAAAPFLAPTTGFLGTMGGRALLAGGANIGAQLAQEGVTEDDLNLLSAGIAAATGALSAPGTSAKLEGFKSPTGDFAGARNIFQKGRDLGITGLQKAADFLSAAEGSGGVGDILRPGGTPMAFNKATATAVGVPLTQGVGDAMYTEAVQLSKQQIIDQALAGLDEGFSNADASNAIRLAMLQYGFSDDEISETIAAAGYKVGGRVGYRFGGIDAALDKVEDEDIKESVKMVADIPDMDLMDLIEEFEITFKRKPMSMEELKQFYRENYEMESPIKLKEKIKEKMTMEAKDGGLMATRINMENGGDLLALGEGFKSERLNRMAMDMFGKTLRELNADEMEMLREEFNIMKGVTEAKDGGLMNLGGKEMDLRGGGFVPIGKKEKADDVPARLSKNEFVMTADAVRAAGGGSINKGAKRMYDLMNNLEARA